MAKQGPATKDLALMAAYQHVFKNPGADGQVDLVLADLAETSGYYSVPDADATALAYARDAGRREVFARILFLLGVSSDYREALRKVALIEQEALHGES